MAANEMVVIANDSSSVIYGSGFLASTVISR